MPNVIMIGCDLHDRSMLICFSVDQDKPHQASFPNNASGRQRMIERLLEFAAAHHSQRIVFAYEASGQGFGLSDLLHHQGIECYVLSPTHLPKTAKSAKNKTDSKDAQMLLEQGPPATAGHKTHGLLKTLAASTILVLVIGTVFVPL